MTQSSGLRVGLSAKGCPALGPDLEGRKVKGDMPTISQLIRKPRQPKTYREKARHLEASPQKGDVCSRV